MPGLEKKTALGLTGEKIARNFLTKKGFVITDALNVYDSNKDFDAEYKGKNYTVEVKTQVPFVTRKALTIKKNQYRKCSSVDLLLFICVDTKVVSKYEGQIYKVNLKSAETYPLEVQGRDMIIIPIEQSAVKSIAKLTGEERALLKKVKSSEY